MKPDDLLAKSSFFESLPDASRRQLARICVLKKAKKREIIFLEGSKGDLFYQLVSGKVQLYRLNDEGREIAIKVVKPGETFAEVILFDQDRYPVCALAITGCELIAVPVSEFSRLLENREFRNDFISMLMKKQRYLTDRIMYLTSNDAENRFFRFVLDQYGNAGEYTIGLSKKAISTAIGVTPETLSRLVHRLSDSDVLDWTGDHLNISRAYLLKFEKSGR